MDEWEWESDSEERDGEDYSEEQDQEEELDPFCEAGQLRTDFILAAQRQNY